MIAFSCLGWIWPATRPWHLALAAGVAMSWFVVGPLVGEPGLCVVTSAQRAVWRRLGRADRTSYMVLLHERLTGRPVEPARVARWTQGVFYATAALSLVLTFT